MNAGELDRYITIQYPSTTKNDYGEGDVDTWTTLASVYAKMEYMGGSEGTEAVKVTAVNKIVFSIRYRTDVQVNYRISYSSKYYYIQYIEEINRREGLRLITEVRD